MTRRLTLALLALSCFLLLLIRASSGAMINPFSDMGNLGTWVAALLTIIILSFLYGDNPFFRFVENVFVGVSAAYWMTTGFWDSIVPKLLANLVPEIPARLFGMDMPGGIGLLHRLAYLVPLALGILLLTQVSDRTRRWSHLPLAYVLGITAGLRLIAELDANFIAQIANCIRPLVGYSDGRLDLAQTLDAVLLSGSVICCLVYFHFTRREDGVLGVVSKTGLWILMVTFGAGFGFTVMGRVALLVGRMEFLLQDWLRLI